MCKRYSLVRYSLVYLFLSALSFDLMAANRQPNYRDIRWLGRGNTGVADVMDGSSAFYNPAGVAFYRGVNFSLISPSAGGNTNLLTAYKEFSTLSSSEDTLSDKFSPYLGRRMDLDANVMSSLTVPFFSLAFYDSFGSSIDFQNPVNPELDLYFRNDWGLATTGAIMPLPGLAIGMSLRYVRRRGLQESIGGGLLFEGATQDFYKDLIRQGEAWAIGVGVQYRRPLNDKLQWSLGANFEDLGQTKYRNRSSEAPPSPSQAQIASFGTALAFEASPVLGKFLFDFRDALDTDKSVTRRLFFGAEFSAFKVDLRAGLYQGYWTAGFSARLLPFVELDLSTYAEERGHSAGQRVNRFWLVGLRSSLELSPGRMSSASGRSSSGRLSLDDIK